MFAQQPYFPRAKRDCDKYVCHCILSCAAGFAPHKPACFYDVLRYCIQRVNRVSPCLHQLKHTRTWVLRIDILEGFVHAFRTSTVVNLNKHLQTYLGTFIQC